HAIRNPYPPRLVGLSAHTGICPPASRIVATDATTPWPPTAVWVKRYDFHATEAHDVMYAASEEGWREALHGFAKRGIPFVVAQEHVPGDLVKFYGVTDAAAPVAASWFEWFYHRDKGMQGYSFEAPPFPSPPFPPAPP